MDFTSITKDAYICVLMAITQTILVIVWFLLPVKLAPMQRIELPFALEHALEDHLQIQILDIVLLYVPIYGMVMLTFAFRHALHLELLCPVSQINVNPHARS